MNRDSTAWFLKYYIFTSKHQEGYIFKLLKHDACCVFGAEKKNSSKSNYSFIKVICIPAQDMA